MTKKDAGYKIWITQTWWRQGNWALTRIMCSGCGAREGLGEVKIVVGCQDNHCRFGGEGEAGGGGLMGKRTGC